MCTALGEDGEAVVRFSVAPSLHLRGDSCGTPAAPPLHPRRRPPAAYLHPRCISTASALQVRLPCHTAAISCTFNLSTIVETLKLHGKCPTCSQSYALPGVQPTGTTQLV